MIGHQAIRKELDGTLSFGFEQKRLECRVIEGILKKWQAFGGSVENVKYDSGGPYPKTSWHGR
jgi:hypothetical protein